ncbi:MULTISPECIES: hypothetical protein [unclassified Pseudomonas]|uniref:hypothetical protein n=1 Tax=unclassified Pseudomonas TaxID=196821 RepID=UPI00083897E4|nr:MULTISPECIES: hypothetical protein [unclassified Pseudomonas]QIH11512.1 hypothetical protein ATY02_34560 [Pseudomonas sp. BIOMIG1BAC]
MPAPFRSVKLYLAVGVLQGGVLMWLLLHSGWTFSAMAVLAAVLLAGGTTLQLQGEQWRRLRSGVAVLLVGLVAAALALACLALPSTMLVVYGVGAALLLIALLGATLAQGGPRLGRRLLDNGLWLLLALPWPWLVQRLFKAWLAYRHLDPFKDGLLSLAFFTGPPLAFSVALFLGYSWRARGFRRRPADCAD